jgi:cyanophycinase-like exopeptidase
MLFFYCIGARDRMGRMLSFLARTQVDYKAVDYRALGVDEQTALLFDVNTGIAKAVGVGNAYICSSPSLPALCVEGQPLKVEGKICY